MSNLGMNLLSSKSRVKQKLFIIFISKLPNNVILLAQTNESGIHRAEWGERHLSISFLVDYFVCIGFLYSYLTG